MGLRGPARGSTAINGAPNPQGASKGLPVPAAPSSRVERERPTGELCSTGSNPCQGDQKKLHFRLTKSMPPCVGVYLHFETYIVACMAATTWWHSSMYVHTQSSPYIYCFCKKYTFEKMAAHNHKSKIIL